MRLRPVALRPLKARRSPNGLRRDGREGEGGGNSYGLMKVLAPVAVAATSRDEEDEVCKETTMPRPLFLHQLDAMTSRGCDHPLCTHDHGEELFLTPVCH